MGIRVKSGCRDCKKCTNSHYANFGRNAGRTGAFFVTFGMSEVVMAGTRNCRVCGHKLRLHRSKHAVTTRDVAAEPDSTSAVTKARAILASAATKSTAAKAVSANPGTPDRAIEAEVYARPHWYGVKLGQFTDDPQVVSASPAVPAEPLALTELSSSALIRNLASLVDMHEAGSLTDEEFTEAKRQALEL